ncbi:MAG TPA: ATP-binding protein [Bacteroidales bacterium]|nr:ATP-binding protein [Bacteroidales bacterium]
MEKNIDISSKIENLRQVEKFVDEISSECKLNSELYGNLLIATLEGANNAIIHGNKLNEQLMVNINAKCENNILEISIKDQGKGFDYKNIPDPTAPENIENVSGRGVFLMTRLSDNIEFFNNGALVVLKFKIN